MLFSVSFLFPVSVSLFSGKVRQFPSSWSSSSLSPPLPSPPHTLHKSPSSTHSFSEPGLFCPPAWASPTGRGIHAAVSWGLALLRFLFFLPVAFSGRSPCRDGKWGLLTVCQHLWESPQISQRPQERTMNLRLTYTGGRRASGRLCNPEARVSPGST